MKLSFFSDKFDSEPQNVELAFGDLAGVLQAEASADKETAALWSPSDMQGGKTEGHTKSVEALALDFDGCEPPWDRLGNWSYFAHTTHSHSEADPHWRVVVELEEPGDPKAWKAQFKAKMAQHDLPMDAKCCNPNRSFFVPPPDAQWRENEGRPAKMPPPGAAVELERQDMSENSDGLVSDGALFWPHVEAMMRSMPAAVSGDDGHGRLFDAACTLRSSFRLNFEASMRALRIFNARCKPQWAEAELAHKVEQAAGDRLHQAGSLVPPAAAAQLRAASGYVEPPPEPEPQASPLWQPAGALVGLVAKVDYLCKDLGIRDGRPSLWTADARCGKSTLAASVALAVASGRKLWGKLAVVPGDVCYVAGEDLEGIGRIWKRLALDQGIAIPSALHVTNLTLAGPNCDESNLKALFSAHKLVIFDTLRSLSREAGIEENDPRFADGLYLLDRASQGTGCSIVVLHHNNKSGKSSGTAALFGAAGNHLEFQREEDGPLRCYAVGTRDGLKVTPFELEMRTNTRPAADPQGDPDSDGIRFEYKATAGAKKQNPVVEKVGHVMYERLKTADRWLTRIELMHDLPGKGPDVALAMAELQEKVGFQMNGKSPMYHWNPAMSPKS